VEPKKQTIVLALDGLDYFLVKRFKLKSLQQEVNYKIYLKEFPILSTHPIWASIISGKLPEEHGIKTITRWKNPVIQYLNEFLSKRLNLLKNTDQISKNILVSDILRKIGFKKIPWGKDYWRKKHIATIFDIIKDSIAISVPTWNEDRVYQLIRKELVMAIGDKKRMKNLEKLLLRDFNKKKRLLFTTIKRKKYNLVFCYFITLDTIGHMYRGDLGKMKRFYQLFDGMVKQLRETFQGRIIIISDHGMKKVGNYGDHSRYAFCSFNFFVERPKSIVDMFHIITSQS